MLISEVETLRDKSIYCDDIEKSRSEISMVAELQKIEAESRLTSLTQEIANLKRTKSEDLAEADRRMGKRLFEAGEAAREKVKRLHEERNAAVSEMEERLNNERRKAREMSERIHDLTIKHHKEVADMQMKIHLLQNNSEKHLLRLSNFKHETEDFINDRERIGESISSPSPNKKNERSNNTSVEELLD